MLIRRKLCLSFRQRRVFQWVTHHASGNTGGLCGVIHIYVNSLNLSSITTGFNITRGDQLCSATTTCCEFIETYSASLPACLQNHIHPRSRRRSPLLYPPWSQDPLHFRTR